MEDLRRYIQARNWMKSNEDFLTTWHAHVGYSLDLFDYFSKSIFVEEVASKYNLGQELLQRWVDVGIVIGHLKEDSKGKIKAKRRLVKFASANSKDSVGILLREMMELHIPTLLKYPELIKENEKITYLEDKFASVVAETSRLLERVAIPPILKIVKKNKPKSIVDVGCGYGGYLEGIAKKNKGIQLVGIEKSSEVAEKAKAHLEGKAEIINQDLKAFFTETSYSFDLIMAHNLLYYFPQKERASLLQKMSNRLNRKGILTIIVPIVNEKQGKAFTSAFNSFMTAHENLYPLPSFEELKEDGKKAELKIIDKKVLIREGGWFIVTLQKK